MSVQLLDKTRKINKLLHNNNSSKVVFNDICDVLKEIQEEAINFEKFNLSDEQNKYFKEMAKEELRLSLKKGFKNV